MAKAHDEHEGEEKGGHTMKGLKARDVMVRPVVSATPHASARDIALQFLSGFYSGMPVTDEAGKVAGMVTEYDLLKNIQKGKELTKLNARDVMVKSPVTVDVETPLSEVIKTMIDNRIIRLPVVEKERLVGVISRCDILKSFIEPEFATYM
jgi:CBS domain-containing protein